ncbi:hypothetical protein IAJ44_004222 [Salmonella enterica]|nr:hypothetical protein [Salmonella enterica]
MDAYHKIAGNVGLFKNAPPLAEVVLENIGAATSQIIYAEAFRPGAAWWHADGRRGRNGLSADRISDFVCAATRTPKPGERDQLQRQQSIWELNHNVSPCPRCGVSGLHACIGMKPGEWTEEHEAKLKQAIEIVRTSEVTQMFHTKPCVNCGTPVADGMIHQCTHDMLFRPSPCPRCGIHGAHFCTGNQTAPANPFRVLDDLAWTDGNGVCRKPKQAADAFVSVFEPQNGDNWMRLNTAGRLKFSEALMLRFHGMKIDVAVTFENGRVRVGESEHGKVLNNRGYCFARRLTPLVDFKGRPSVLIFLHENEDGYLYGDLSLAEGADAPEVE